MSYQVKTEVFEGPLDLLLQLITSHQVAIVDLSLSDLVTEYLSYLDAMLETDLEVTSEFLLIAATLIQLKAHYLLPDESEFDLDEELALAEERDRLLSRLLACLTFKDVAAVIAHRLEASQRLLPRLAGLDADIRPAPPALQLTIAPADLGRLATKVIHRRRDVDLDHLEFDLPSVEDAIADLQRRVAEAVESDFDTLVVHADRPLDMIAYFLALLELVRWGFVAVSQESRDGAIRVEHRPGSDDHGFRSEWSLRGDQGAD